MRSGFGLDGVMETVDIERQLDEMERSLLEAKRVAGRPIGIDVLTWLSLLSGGVCLIGLIFLAADGLGGESQPGSSAMIGIFAVLATEYVLATGVGLLLGKKWGWYLGSFSFLSGVVMRLHDLLFMRASGAVAEMPPPSGARDGARIIVSVLIGLLVYAYFLKKNVRGYFAVDNVPKWKAIVVELVLSLALLYALGVSGVLDSIRLSLSR
jgi:hypothetical protein